MQVFEKRELSIYTILIFILFILLLPVLVYAHVCNDVVGGSQAGCPDPETVEYISSSSSGNRFTIVSDVTAKHVQFKQHTWGCSCTGTEADGCYDNNDYDNKCNQDGCFTSGFTVQQFTYSVAQGTGSYLTFSSNPTTPSTLADKQTRRFNLYVDVNPSAPSQHFSINIGMRGSLSSTTRPIYNLQFDWEASCTPNCAGKQCGDDGCGGSCGTCSDSNACTTDTCSSGSCSYSRVANGTSCSGGTCCSGVCDTSVGNSGFASSCRSGPICVGSSWEYSVANTGSLCGGFACRECSSGYCTVDDSSNCASGYTCSSGSCVANCTNECSPQGARQCSGNSYQVCGNYDVDSCLEWGSLTACSGGTPYCTGSGSCVACTQASHCADNVCKEPSCSSGVCGETYVASGGTDESCYGSVGCVGGSCACNGAGSCTSQPVCSNDCSPQGARQCSGNSYQVCGNYDVDSCLEWGSLTACSGGTPYCTGSGSCVACTQASHCSDSNECTSDTCSSNVCSNSRVANGTSCSGGTCCSGTCDTSLGNSGFASACRSGPSCVGTSWQYNVANTGALCGGYACRQCSAGLCSYDNSSRCPSGQVCASGSCASTGCTIDSQCSAPTPYCNTASGSCVACLLASHCNDNNLCTTDSCVANACSNTNVADNTACATCSGTSCRCISGSCTCVPSCTGKACGDDGCGGSCGSCTSYISGSSCYDESVCSNGICSFTTSSLSSGTGCCNKEFYISSGQCLERDVLNSSKCNSTQYCSSSCECSRTSCDSFNTKSQCIQRANCDWCPFMMECLAKEAVECTDELVCYADNKVCTLTCTLSPCAGTPSSCGCVAGGCKACGTGEICENNVCKPGVCTPSWVCGDWGECAASGKQTRVCTDHNSCGSLENKPLTTMSCTYTVTAGANVSTEVSETGKSEISEEEPEIENPSTIETTKRESGKGFPWITGAIVFIIFIGGLGALIYLKGRKGFSGSEPGGTGSEEQKIISLAPDQERALSDYVNDCLAKNYTSTQIREGLIRSGWPAKVVDDLLKRFF